MEENPCEEIAVNLEEKDKVRGLVYSVFVHNCLSWTEDLVKFSVEFHKYLRLHGYVREDLMIITSHCNLKDEILEDQKDSKAVWIGEEFRETEYTNVKIVIVCLGSAGEFRSELLPQLVNILSWAMEHADGVYFLGNVQHLLAHLSTAEMYLKLMNEGLVNEFLPLRCEAHGTISRASFATAFSDQMRCSERCPHSLPCGHACPSLCHLQDQSHKKQKCIRICGKTCPNGHECEKICHPKCQHPSHCEVDIVKDFPCGHSLRFKCHQGKPLNCSQLPGAFFTNCGHLKEGTRPCTRPYVCRNEEHKEDVLSKIYRRKNNKGAEYFLIKRSTCAHYVRIKEAKELKDALAEPCGFPCQKSCRFGHQCFTNHLCYEKCPPCEHRVTVYSSFCRHPFSYVCHQYKPGERLNCTKKCDRNKKCGHPCPIKCGDHVNGECPPCELIVTTKRSCGHDWTHPCDQVKETDEKCFEIVDLSCEATCGHQIQVPCWQKSEIYPGETSLRCESKCGFYFDPSIGGCGHTCDEICSTCMVSGIHGPCDRPCGKTLICGHQCESMCGVLCPPCQKPCENKCEHCKCNKVCSLPCEPCEEPCVYGCMHGKCTEKCGQACSKPACQEPCPERLQKCGHACAGFCGEPCPPLCKICDKDELLKNDLLGKADLGSEDRFVVLVDCGHIIDSEALKALMNVSTVSGEIVEKVCPVCRKSLRNLRRFNHQLLKIKQDLTQVKQLIVGTKEQVLKNYREAHACIKEGVTQGLQTPFLELAEKILISVYHGNAALDFNLSKDWLGKARNLVSVARVFQKGLELHRNAERLPSHLKKRLRWVLEVIMEGFLRRQWPMTEFQFNMVMVEWDRAVAMDLLYSKWGEDQPAVIHRLLRYETGERAFNNARDILDAVGSFTTELKEKFERAVQELEAVLETKLGISDEERVQILKAFDNAVGRWFKCPNGHIYVVTECGGATEEGICNECKAPIGGLNHAVLPTNDLASDMDGAVEPLYPTALMR